MSRAFIKEDASASEVSIPPRAPLRAGTPNYVTPKGLALLKAEEAELLAELAELQAGNDAAAVALVEGRLELLLDRLSSAQLIDPSTLPQDTVNIGATVRLEVGGQEHRLSIVGVDEADALAGKVAFTAPIAQALLGHKVGNSVSLETAKGKQRLTILAVGF